MEKEDGEKRNENSYSYGEEINESIYDLHCDYYNYAFID